MSENIETTLFLSYDVFRLIALSFPLKELYCLNFTLYPNTGDASSVKTILRTSRTLAKGLDLLFSKRCAKGLRSLIDTQYKDGAEGAHLLGALLLTFLLDEHIMIPFFLHYLF